MVSPATFRHFGLAYGHGIVGNLRARPWLAAFVPAFLWSFRRAAARAAAPAARPPGGGLRATGRGPWYERAAVLAAPFRREGYGVTVREAMGWGRPVVAAAVGGLRDALEDEQTGLLVPPGDVSALRTALERLLADERLRRRLGATARAHAREHLSWESATDRLLDAYDAATGTGQRIADRLP